MFVVLIFSGKRLKICAPLTGSELSLDLLMTAGQVLTTGFGITILPLLMPPEEKSTSYPETSPWLIFHRKIT